MPHPTKSLGLTRDMSRTEAMVLPRPLRLQVGTFHLGSRGVRKLPVFTNDDTRRRFLSLVDSVIAKYHWQLHTFCLMTNHYHLLVETEEPTLSVGMQYLLSRYAQWFDWREAYEGHLFERRFFSREIEGDRDVLATSRYILLNPVRAGICHSAADWKWSSFGATAGTTSAATSRPRLSSWTLDYFGRRNPERARDRFADFIRAGEAEARSRRPGRG
jgi:putative transposase